MEFSNERDSNLFLFLFTVEEKKKALGSAFSYVEKKEISKRLATRIKSSFPYFPIYPSMNKRKSKLHFVVEEKKELSVYWPPFLLKIKFFPDIYQ